MFKNALPCSKQNRSVDILLLILHMSILFYKILYYYENLKFGVQK